jgi:uncharacterized protein YndB with AHSA1/START domain/DNA-binding transcriptional ArsR family regulator
MNDNMEKIFRALADPNRLKILDIVKDNPGINVNEITKKFYFSRYAVMKHLKILENVELIVPKRSGKYKELYINVMPIQLIYDRWISKYSAIWAKKLTSLKHSLEMEENNMNKKALCHVFVLFIKTTKEKLWDALTNPEMTRHYYYGSTVHSSYQKGSKIEYFMKDEKGNSYAEVYGEILEIEPYKRLIHSFNFSHKNDNPSKVIYEIEEDEIGVKLTVTHTQFEEETETYKIVGEGWPFILSALKTIIETGKPLK